MILVDTSVWIAHFRQRVPDLAALLDEQQVLTHPFVIGELACGQIRQRAAILRMLGELPCAVPASHDEVLQMIEGRRLWGTGIGMIDFHLLASAALSGCRFWTIDRRLAEMAAAMGLDWRYKL